MTSTPSFSVTADLPFVPATLRAPQPEPATNDNQTANTIPTRKGWITAITTVIGSAVGITTGLALTSAPVIQSAGQVWRNVCTRLDAGACVGKTLGAMAQFAQGHEPPIAFAVVVALFFIRGYVVRTITER
ncbi:MAG TPA: hypothetical protein VGM17_18660 [Rhizomicrobium sp.]|jgi:hypothetical protein